MTLGTKEIMFSVIGKSKRDIVNDTGARIRDVLGRYYGHNKRKWPMLDLERFHLDEEELRVIYNIVEPMTLKEPEDV